jgi:DNA-binding NarL/FixJ family response regulator
VKRRHITPPQRQIGDLIARSHSSKDIAALLGLTKWAASHRAMELLKVCQVKSRIELAIRWKWPIFQLGLDCLVEPAIASHEE